MFQKVNIAGLKRQRLKREKNLRKKSIKKTIQSHDDLWNAVQGINQDLEKYVLKEDFNNLKQTTCKLDEKIDNLEARINTVELTILSIKSEKPSAELLTR